MTLLIQCLIEKPNNFAVEDARASRSQPTDSHITMLGPNNIYDREELVDNSVDEFLTRVFENLLSPEVPMEAARGVLSVHAVHLITV